MRRLFAAAALLSGLALAEGPRPVITESGASVATLKDGTGPSPTAADKVRVHYRGTFRDGREFDSSYKRHEPATFPLNAVIKCWTEGLQHMKTGGRARLTCPPSTAYGEAGVGKTIPPNATLVFEVELLEVISANPTSGR